LIMPTKTARLQIRITPALERKIAELAQRWGSAVPLSTSDVVRVAVERAYQREFSESSTKTRKDK